MNLFKFFKNLFNNKPKELATQEPLNFESLFGKTLDTKKFMTNITTVPPKFLKLGVPEDKTILDLAEIMPQYIVASFPEKGHKHLPMEYMAYRKSVLPAIASLFQNTKNEK